MNWRKLYVNTLGSFYCALTANHLVSERAVDATFEQPDFKIKSDCERCKTPIVTWLTEDGEGYYVREEYHEYPETRDFPFRYRDLDSE